MGFLQNLKVYFNQKSLPITYHNFPDPKVNPQIEKDLNPLAAKPIFHRKKPCT